MRRFTMKKISIIVATFNAKNTLQSCLDSIREQKEEDIELLIIDGGSTDKTQDIIRQNIDIIDYYISESDNGIYDAWNKGIKVSNGEWILFLGADDSLLPDALSKYRLYLSEKSNFYEYISARVYYLNESGQIIKILGEKWNWNTFRKSMTVAHVASLHKKSLFKDIGLFNTAYKICADYEFLMRKEDQLKASFLNETVAQMRAGGISLSKAAIKETCQIVASHTSETCFYRFLFVSGKYLSYYLFLFKIKMKGLF